MNPCEATQPGNADERDPAQRSPQHAESDRVPGGLFAGDKEMCIAVLSSVARCQPSDQQQYRNISTENQENRRWSHAPKMSNRL